MRIVAALLLIWVFLGVALGADAFMTSIETITAQTRITTVTIKGEKKRFHTRVWNDTVANLTLMALGSSAPEILLSVIETIILSKKGPFYSGELGPSTIVGSAAFNLMVIIAVCVVALPEGETRTLKHLSVFLVTASFSIFAYLWCVLVLVLWTPNLVTLTEAILTLAFMIVLVAIAYCADKGWLSASGASYASRSLKVLSVRKGDASGEGGDLDTDLRGTVPELSAAEVARYLKILESGEREGGTMISVDVETSEGKEVQRTAVGSAAESAEGGEGVRGGKQAMTAEEIAAGIRAEQEKSRPKTRTEHRAKALGGALKSASTKASMKALLSPARKRNHDPNEEAAKIIEASDVTMDDVHRTTFVGFVSSIVQVMEGNDEFVLLTVCRHGCLDGTLTVKYATTDGTAKAASDYMHTEGVLTFTAETSTQQIKVPIVDDDEIEDDEEFYVTLSSPELSMVSPEAALWASPEEARGDRSAPPVKPRLAGPKLYAECTVLIKDDDVMPGTLQWKESDVRTVESEGQVVLTVERRRGHNGEVTVQYDTKPKEALEGVDYVGAHGTLTFGHGVMSQTITIGIVDDTAYEKDERFLCILSEPTGGAIFRDDTDGRSDSDICTITIESDGGVRSKVDRVVMLLRLDRQKMSKCSDEWFEQLKEAVQLPTRAAPSVWVTNVLLLPWKVLFALLPPPDACGGWGLFYGALAGIGFQVFVIGDLATQLGCEIGMPDSVTAITIVALGTSLPDLFASMQAARDDPTADNSIGNVTGSNSVNVFMGLGVPWVMASIYWSFNKNADGTATQQWKSHYPDLAGTYPEGGYIVCAGSLAFSVVVFSVVALCTLGIILLRRFAMSPAQELGGNKMKAYITFGVFIFLYVMYLLFSILRVAGVVEGFNAFMLTFTESSDCV